jgi:DNA-binding transcriptional LysR family regulator
MDEPTKAHPYYRRRIILRTYPLHVKQDIANTPDVVAKVLNFEVDIGMIEGEVQHRELDSGASHTFERALAGILPDINIYLELKHNEAIKNAVESGLGIGCLSANGPLAHYTVIHIPAGTVKSIFKLVNPRFIDSDQCVPARTKFSWWIVLIACSQQL